MEFHGLFVGIDRYASPKINWLNCSRRDAVALHALFADTLGGNLSLLADEAATRSNIESEFDRLSRCSEDDFVVVAFSGHGTSTHQLVTYDADLGDIDNTCIPLDLLTDWFARIPVKRLLCVLDCCFSGGMGAKVLQIDIAPKDLDSTDSLLEKLSGNGRLILTASTATQPAWEIGRLRHSLLTYHVLQGLQGCEEVRDNGKVGVYPLLKHITQRVMDGAKGFGKEQHPTIRGTIDGEMTLPVFVRGERYKTEFPEYADLQATSDLASLEPLGIPEPLLQQLSQTIPSLNDLQLTAINDFDLLNDEHLVVSAPTSSGKTLIGELAAVKDAMYRRRSLFLLPLKALVNDKHKQFTKNYGPFGLKVIRATGEFADDIPALMRGQYDICLMTYEKFAATVVGQPHILEQVGTVVVDEVQMIADESRGANLEFVLTLLRMRRRQGIEPQLIALSAVIGDTNGLERWLDARLLRRNERPVPLDEGILRADGSFRHIDPLGNEAITESVAPPEYRKGSSQDWVIPLVRKLVGEGKQVIVFREVKGETRGCALYLANALGLPSANDTIAALPDGDPSKASTALRQALAGGVAFHNANLERDERLAIEEYFRQPDSEIRVIVATTTLAMGVNTPAEAVVVVGLEHPGNKPYSVAEYKNIVGRAGRLGFSNRGTSYLLALDPHSEAQAWSRYVRGTPEDVVSRFVSRDTDPRSLILRVLASAQKSSVDGIPLKDIVGFLEASFGAYQQVRQAENWQWDRGGLVRAFDDLLRHKLLESTTEDHYHLTELGRLAGEGGVEVESVIRVIDALQSLHPDEITDPTLIAATQITVELDGVLIPLNKKSTQKEPRTWSSEMRRQGIAEVVHGAMNRTIVERHTPTARKKKTAACLLWITNTSMGEIEAILTKHGGAFGGAAGPVRSVSSRTNDLLPYVARVAELLHPGLELSNRVGRLVLRLELGIPSDAVELASYVGGELTRGDYLRLLSAGLCQIDNIEKCDDDTLLKCVGKNKEKLERLREAVREYQDAEPVVIQSPLIPLYVD